MFIKEYECRDCHEKYKKEEKWGFMAAVAEETCPKCGSRNVWKVSSPYEGGGFLGCKAVLGGG